MMDAADLITHARIIRNDLAGELPNGVGNTIDALCDAMEEMTRPPPTPKAIVTDEMTEAGRRQPGAWGYSDDLLIGIYTAMHAASPEASEIMREALEKARGAIASLDEDAFPDVLAKIDEALSSRT